MLGRVVDLNPLRQALGLLGWERFIEAGRRMGVELVHDQHQRLGLPVAPLQKGANEACPVGSAALACDLNTAPALEGFTGEEQARGSVADINMIVALHGTGPGWQGLAGLANQLLEGLVDAHHGPLGIVRPMVDLEDVLHVVDELRRVFLGDAPHPPLVRLERIFLSV